MEVPIAHAEMARKQTDWPAIALVGCGAIAEQFYLPVLAKHPQLIDRLVLIDADEERARKLAGQYGARHAGARYEDFVGSVQGAIVAVPTQFHYPISIDFLSSGVDVLCEKPLAESYNRAKDMVSQAKRSGAVLMVNHQRRVYPNLAKAHEIIQARTLGELRSIRYFVGEKFDWPSRSGFYFRAEPRFRGVLRDRGSHVVDVICWWLGGKPDLISSENDSFGGSEAVAEIRFEHESCQGEIRLSWLSKFPGRFWVDFESGSIAGDIYDYNSILVASPSTGGEQHRMKAGQMGYSLIAARIIENFIGVIQRSQDPIVPAQDVLASIQFIDECYASGRRFSMPWYDGLSRSE